MTPLREPLSPFREMQAAGEAMIDSLESEGADYLAVELMRGIVEAIAYRNPKIGIISLIRATTSAMRKYRWAQSQELTPLRDDDEAPWLFRDTAEYHYAMAARERQARGE